MKADFKPAAGFGVDVSSTRRVIPEKSNHDTLRQELSDITNAVKKFLRAEESDKAAWETVLLGTMLSAEDLLERIQPEGGR